MASFAFDLRMPHVRKQHANHFSTYSMADDTPHLSGLTERVSLFIFKDMLMDMTEETQTFKTDGESTLNSTKCTRKAH